MRYTFRQTMTNLHGIPIKSSSFGVGRSFSNLFNWWYPRMTSPAGIGGTSGTPQWGKTVGGVMGRKLGFGMWLPISKYLKISRKHVVNTKKNVGGLDDRMMLGSDQVWSWDPVVDQPTWRRCVWHLMLHPFAGRCRPWLEPHAMPPSMRIKALGWLSMAKECWLRQGWRWFADIVHFPLSEMMTPKDEYWVEAINPNLVREQRCTLQLA